MPESSSDQAAIDNKPEALDQPETECQVESTESCSLDLGDGLAVSTTDDTTITDNGDGTVTIRGVFQVNLDSSLEINGIRGVGVSAFAKLLDPAYATAS